jgi:tetratricopeptide (TPR) repeat protein
VSVWDRILKVLDATETEPWRREVWALSRAWFAEKEDHFDRFLGEDSLAVRTGEELAWLTRPLATVRWTHPSTFALIDRAIRIHPDSFDLHFARGGLSLSAARDGGPDKSEKLAKAIHHLQVAVALRPDAALVHGALGSAHALAGEYAEARSGIENAVRLGPKDALAWFMKGRFHSEDPEPAARQEAILALRKSIDLDPKLDPAREILASLEAR